MAQLRDTVVSGSLRATDTLYSTTAQFQILRAPTSSNGTTFGPGSANNLLKSNGTSVYWTTLAASDIPNLSTDKLTSGTLGVARGGTGQTSIANIQAGKDGDGNTITSKYVTVDTTQTITGTKSWGSGGAGGALNGAATNGGINSIKIGDDVWLGDCNVGGIMGMKSTSTNCGFYMYNSSGTQIGKLYFDGTNLVCDKTIQASITGSAGSVAWGNVTGKPNRAGSDSDGGPAQMVKGTYTSNGGQQNPNYFGTNKVGFLMMNTTVNGNSNYKDWLIMDCYSGTDVGGGVAIGVNRQALGAYIMRSAAARSSWAESAELLGTHNYTSYCPTKTGSGASGTWGINVTGNAANVTGTVAVDHGGTGATTATNARTNLGLGSIATYGAAPAGTKDTWGLVPVIGGSDGVMEIGKYIDFHTTDGNTADYDVRISATTSGLTISGTTTGTFSGNLTGTATKATQDADGNTISSTYLKKSGGTMTGNLNIENSGDTYAVAKNTNTGATVYLDSAPNGTHGIWSDGYYNGSNFVTDSKWMIYRSTDGSIYINGNAATASKCSSLNLTDVAFSWSGSYSTGSWMLIYNGETSTNGGALFKAINQTYTANWVRGGANGTWGVSITGNAATATSIIDAGDNSKTLTIRYWGSGASATDWIPMYENGTGNLVPVSSTNLANKIREKAGTLPIGYGGTGATTKNGAKRELGIYKHFIESSASELYDKIIDCLPENGNVAYFSANSTGINTLGASSKIGSTTHVGLIFRYSSTEFRFFSAKLDGTPNKLYNWTVTYSTSTHSFSFSNGYSFTGTAL